jgi:hypothetical protein
MTDLQKKRFETMAQAKALCEAVGCVVRLEALGVLLIVTPEHGDAKDEQLLLEATEPKEGSGGKTRG